ncbi:MAG: hypothetical protein Q9227_006861 [Pyrenula ochraceoflavens]
MAGSYGHPALDPSVTGVPVTPGINNTGKSAYGDEVKPQKPSLHWNSNSYFAPKDSVSESPNSKPPESPEEAAKGVQSGAELLRRLSLATPLSPESLDQDPKAAYPGLKLTGNIISAAVCIPYAVAFRPGSEWILRPRRGTSALFDSFSYLSSSQHWSHTLVGWTGEVEPVCDPLSPPTTRPDAKPRSRESFSSSNSRSFSIPLNKASAPIPVDASQPAPLNPHVDGLRVTESDRRRLENRLHDDPNGRILPVWLSDDLEDGTSDIVLKDQGRWRRYAEHELYALFHYKQHAPDDGRAEHRWWEDYKNMNERFAQRIIEIYKPGDVIWIHDYHLMLLPNLLRQHLPNAYIGYFLHIPFPSSEFLRCLPRRKDVLTGCLGASMVGFQSFSYSRHFSSCCTRILGFDSTSAGVDAYGAHVAVDVFPIGIDTDSVQKAAFSDSRVEDNIQGIKNLYSDKKIIVGRDRLDTVRGVAQKLQAFEKFLERYPEWQNKVVLIQVTSPTSVREEEEDSHHQIGNRISELVSRINGLYGSLSFSPVLHYPQYLSRQEYFALLRVADVGLITSVRDGMNTTSLEYVICQRESHGPLILSEFSGTAGCLSSAIHINPWDLGGVATEINKALTMPPEEKTEMHKKLYRHVKTHTVATWIAKFTNRLLTNLSSSNQGALTPALDRSRMLKQYTRSGKRLFMFDYDGTLTPIVKEPQAAIPSDKVLRSLKTLAADPDNIVWIISGRDQAFLDEWMGSIPELGLSAEHGSFVRPPRSENWENLTERMDMGWQKEVMDVFQHYTEKTQGSVIERKRVALTWHYRRADPEYGAFQATACREHLEKTVVKKYEVEVMAGKANLEVRPRFVNKGFIATRLVAENLDALRFILCCGDDFTDEGEYFSMYTHS